MTDRRNPTWLGYTDSIGDRSSLFVQLAERWPIRSALYPGSYVDLSPSVAIASVTFVDIDKRAAKFFGNRELIHSQLRGRASSGAAEQVVFLHQDYTTPLALPLAGFDLLISLYAGLVWDNCRQYLAPGGMLLANASHGDASIAALDPDLELIAAIHHRAGHYRLRTDDLHSYLVPKRPVEADAETIRAQGRGVGYTRPAFAYLFRLR